MGKRAEIILENGILDSSVDDHGSQIYTSVGYSIHNEGATGPRCSKEGVKKAIEDFKRSLIEKGYSPVVVDKRAKFNKGKLDSWMQESNKKVMKIYVKWRWEKNHEKYHHRIEWVNHDEFGDMVGKKGYGFCCDWEDEVQDHDVRNANSKGDFITEGYEPGQHDPGAGNIVKIREWLKKNDD